MTAVVVAVVFVLFIALWYYVPVMGSDESTFCARCHSMAPEYLTWQSSNHAQFQCRECHREPGVTGFIRYQGRIFIETLFYRSGGNGLTKVNSGSVSNSVCLGCHSKNRKYSPSSDTVVPHQKHLDKGINCIDCHAGVAHGRIVERGITAKIPAEEWGQSLADEQMDFEFSTPRMSTCLDCHGKRRVSQNCSICHSRQLVPTTHKTGDWERQHGFAAQKDFKPCNLCHSYSFNQSLDLTALTVQSYIKNNTFCYNCHLQKPSTHRDPKFREIHGDLVKSRGLDNCFSCHNINKNEQNSNRGPINKVYCNKCHWFK
ncbi:MAG: cytochrome c3 family protein [Eubacteriales bacterium]